MAFHDAVRNSYQADIQAIKAAGLFKEERFIHSPQSSEIEVEFPVGTEIKRCINVCANNYLGFSSHPEVIAAAHAGLDSRGYGMSSVRFICGTQDIHRELENRLTKFLGTGYPPVSFLYGRQRRLFRGLPERAGRDDRRPLGPRLDH